MARVEGVRIHMFLFLLAVRRAALDGDAKK